MKNTAPNKIRANSVINTFSHQVTGTKSFILFMTITLFTRGKKLASTVFLTFFEWVFAPIVKSSIFVNHATRLANPILHKVSFNCYNSNLWVKSFVHGLFISFFTASIIRPLSFSFSTSNESKYPCQSFSKSNLMSLCLIQTPISQQHPLPNKSLQFIQCLTPMSLYVAILFTDTIVKSYVAKTISAVWLMFLAWAKFTYTWSFQYLLNRPTPPYAVFKKSTLKSFFSRPLSKWFCFVFISKQMIIRSIKVLIPQSIKTTILRVISLRWVNAVNGGILLAMNLAMIKIKFVHIHIKTYKLLPSFANLNSFCPVAFESIMSRIFTSLLHSTPNPIHTSSRHSMFHSLSLAKVGKIVNQFYTLPVYNFNPTKI